MHEQLEIILWVWHAAVGAYTNKAWTRAIALLFYRAYTFYFILNTFIDINHFETVSLRMLGHRNPPDEPW